MAQDPGFDNQEARGNYYGGGVWGPSETPAQASRKRTRNWLRARAIKNKLRLKYGGTRLTGGKYSPLSGK